MALRNDFLWSHSRSKAFQRCRREFYLRVWGGWGGWETKASPETRLNYQLSKMTNLDMWAGAIVHETIQGFLVNRNTDYDWQAELSNRMNQDWRRSKAEAWKQDPKYNLNLFEHFYHVPVSASRAEALKEKIRTCLRNFVDSEMFSLILAGDFHVEAIEELAFFDVEGFRVCVKLDLLGVDTANGEIWAWDWKTGRSNADDRDQAELYALYVCEARGREQVQVGRYYLASGIPDAEAFTRPMLERRFLAVAAECREIRKRLTDHEKNTTSIELWEPTDDYSKCSRCPYHVVCHGTREIRSIEAVA